MSARDWKAGDVAMVTAFNRPTPYRAYFDGKTWHTHGEGMFCVDAPTTIRPLVVIDPDDRDQVERLLDNLVAAYGAPAQYDRPRSIDNYQAALRSLIEPPRPEEPTGWGAVVEDDTGTYWTLFAPEAGVWINYHEGRRRYLSIAAVRVVSKGVTA